MGVWRDPKKRRTELLGGRYPLDKCQFNAWHQILRLGLKTDECGLS